MFALHELTRIVKKRKTVGRGGERGGTSGRGNKGQRARTSGNARPAFEGGQMPLYRRLPKRGFDNSMFQRLFVTIGLDKLDNMFNDGDTVTQEILLERGIIKAPKGGKAGMSVGFKVLGNGKLTKKLIVLADAFSESAKKAIQDCGGEARIIKEN